MIHWSDYKTTGKRASLANHKFGSKRRDFKSLIDYKSLPEPSAYWDNLPVENYLIIIRL